MKQGLDKYGAKEKTDWRGWQWNRIVERLSVPVEEAVAVYLCGPEDLDREKAVSRGFRPENLIAVDFAEENIARVRAAGGIGICGDLHSVLGSWPDDWRVDVVVADYCGGIQAYLQHLELSLFFRPAFSVCAVSVNLMRGRDSYYTKKRTKWFGEMDNGASARAFNPSKHRGYHFLCSVMGSFVYQATDGEGAGAEFVRAWVEGNQPVTLFSINRRRAYRFEPPHAAFHSYTSTGKTYFDSVVFRWVAPEFRSRFERAVVKTDHWDDAATKRKISACRAVRTMRIRGAA